LGNEEKGRDEEMRRRGNVEKVRDVCCCGIAV